MTMSEPVEGSLIKVPSQVGKGLILLFFRVSAVLFLLCFPVLVFGRRIILGSWVRSSLLKGLHYTFSPLQNLSQRATPELVSLPISQRLLPPPTPPKPNLNAATVEELRKIEGVGFVKAMEIIEYRERYGDYRRIEELGMIPGIGANTIKQIEQIYEVTADH